AAASQMNQDVLAAKNDLTAARAASQEIRRLEAEETAAHRAVEGSTQRLKQFRNICGRVDGNRATETALTKDLPGLHARELELRTTLLRTQEQIGVAESLLQGIFVRQQQLEKLAAAAVRVQRKEELGSQLATLEQAARELLDLEAQLANLEI